MTTTIVERAESPAVPTLHAPGTNLFLDSTMLESVLRVADLMSQSVVSVPLHFRGKPGDCLAVITQAMQWQMNPYAVAQKTHLSQSGALGYEAQLINAVVSTRAPIKSRPDFEFFGDWQKILGKVEEKKNDNGKKYYVSAWDKKDEQGLGVRCWATFKGETEPREVDVLLAQCWPRFSTQWATDPQQQITYAAVRKWARRYAPDVILGVHTTEELDSVVPPAERDMGAADEVVADRSTNIRDRLSGDSRPEPAKADRVPTLADVLQAIQAATTPEAMTAAAELVARLTGGDKEKGRKAYSDRMTALKAAAKAATPGDAATQGGPSYAEIADAINTAKTLEALTIARDLIRSVPDDGQRAELTALAARRADEMAEGGGA
jgi:hypothetical protein